MLDSRLKLLPLRCKTERLRIVIIHKRRLVQCMLRSRTAPNVSSTNKQAGAPQSRKLCTPRPTEYVINEAKGGFCRHILHTHSTVYYIRICTYWTVTRNARSCVKWDRHGVLSSWSFDRSWIFVLGRQLCWLSRWFSSTKFGRWD